MHSHHSGAVYQPLPAADQKTFMQSQLGMLSSQVKAVLVVDSMISIKTVHVMFVILQHSKRWHSLKMDKRHG